MLEPARLFLKRHVLAGPQIRFVDFGDQMPQVVGSPLRVSLASGERLHLAGNGEHVFVSRAHASGGGGGGAERIEDGALRFLIEQRLRFMLPVQAHERTTDFGEYRGGSRCAVDPRARAPARDDLAAQDESRRVVHIHAARIEQRDQIIVARRIENSFYRCLLRTGADEICRPPLTEQEAERADDDGFPCAGFTGENVEARRERQGERVDDREIPDAQLSEHPTPRRARGVPPNQASAACGRRTYRRGR